MRTVSTIEGKVAGMLSVAGTIPDIEEARSYVLREITSRQNQIKNFQSDIKALHRLLNVIDDKWDEIEGGEDLERKVEA